MIKIIKKLFFNRKDKKEVDKNDLKIYNKAKVLHLDIGPDTLNLSDAHSDNEFYYSLFENCYEWEIKTIRHKESDNYELGYPTLSLLKEYKTTIEFNYNHKKYYMYINYYNVNANKFYCLSINSLNINDKNTYLNFKLFLEDLIKVPIIELIQ